MRDPFIRSEVPRRLSLPRDDLAVACLQLSRNRWRLSVLVSKRSSWPGAAAAVSSRSVGAAARIRAARPDAGNVSGAKAFVVIVHEGPDAAGFLHMTLDLHGPAFERGFAFPKQPAVAMESATVVIVASADVTQQTHGEEIGLYSARNSNGARLRWLSGLMSAPSPADAMPLAARWMILGAMPAVMAEVDRKAIIARAAARGINRAQPLPFLRRRTKPGNWIRMTWSFGTERLDGAQETAS